MTTKIIFYELSDGSMPVADYLSTLDVKIRAKAAKVINQLAEKGNDLRMPQSEFLEDGIFQLRVHFRNDQIRIMYFFFYNDEVILTNAFTKKTRRTPVREIKAAKVRKADYIRRHRND
ncbi:MAG: type II toxin-antitoxin system RelE/ParE family toxin [Eubacterium sp.]|nr:type II toxin-antitoxin system RelE/ParE family toxin [Eubacterium sp.]MBR3201936.1 type II toxin-antitoxin system RelE/ParE family toxin [Mogibacterium sp.]